MPATAYPHARYSLPTCPLQPTHMSATAYLYARYSLPTNLWDIIQQFCCRRHCHGHRREGAIQASSQHAAARGGAEQGQRVCVCMVALSVHSVVLSVHGGTVLRSSPAVRADQ